VQKFFKGAKGFSDCKGCSEDFQGDSEILISTNKSLTLVYLKILQFISFTVKISTKVFKKFIKCGKSLIHLVDRSFQRRLLLSGGVCSRICSVFWLKMYRIYITANHSAYVTNDINIGFEHLQSLELKLRHGIRRFLS
jgi:hypothetical protein